MLPDPGDDDVLPSVDVVLGAVALRNQEDGEGNVRPPGREHGGAHARGEDEHVVSSCGARPPLRASQPARIPFANSTKNEGHSKRSIRTGS